MRKIYCDFCGAEISHIKVGETRPNVDLRMGEYRLKIDITRVGYVTELCQACLVGMVSEAILESDPYGTVWKYRDTYTT